jgi:hypothetical protein
MRNLRIDLYRAADNDETFAIRLPTDNPHTWRAERGYGGSFQKIWTVEFEMKDDETVESLDWDALLIRAVEAYRLSDPVITGSVSGQSESI